MVPDRDAKSRDPLPTSMGAKGVVSAGTALAVRVLHKVGAEALVEVTLGVPGSTDLHLLHVAESLPEGSTREGVEGLVAFVGARPAPEPIWYPVFVGE
jgi:hypothetical protein